MSRRLLRFEAGAIPRVRALRLWLVLSALVLADNTGAQTSLPLHYAESVAVYVLAPDGSGELRFRLGRFPDRGRGILWMSGYVNGRHYAVVDPAISLEGSAPATPVSSDTATFEVAQSQGIRVASFRRHSAAMIGYVTATTRMLETYHPPVGAGTRKISAEIVFSASHGGVKVRPGRFEVFGTAEAQVTTPEGTFRISGPAKWHEQTGPRSQFAPAFTYFWGSSGRVGLLARGGSSGESWGYLVEGATVTPVERFTIEPSGPGSRRFSVGLADGRLIEGSAAELRESSVPIEDRRRPSSTVRIDSDLGAMIGHLNDWDPAGTSE